MTLRFTKTDVNSGSIPVLWDQSRVDLLGNFPTVVSVLQQVGTDPARQFGTVDYQFGEYPVYGPTTLLINQIDPLSDFIYVKISS